MFGRRLFDQIFICDRRMVASTLFATFVLGSCAPQDNFITATLQSTSDWLNDVPPAPEAREWRLSKRPDLANAPYPKLSDVPPRPSDLPTAQAVQERVTALERDNAAAGATGSSDRPSAEALGGPPPARVEPLTIPGVGVVGRR